MEMYDLQVSDEKSYKFIQHRTFSISLAYGLEKIFKTTSRAMLLFGGFFHRIHHDLTRLTLVFFSHQRPLWPRFAHPFLWSSPRFLTSFPTSSISHTSYYHTLSGLCRSFADREVQRYTRDGDVCGRWGVECVKGNDDSHSSTQWTPDGKFASLEGDSSAMVLPEVWNSPFAKNHTKSYRIIQYANVWGKADHTNQPKSYKIIHLHTVWFKEIIQNHTPPYKKNKKKAFPGTLRPLWDNGEWMRDMVKEQEKKNWSSIVVDENS